MKRVAHLAAACLLALQGCAGRPAAGPALADAGAAIWPYSTPLAPGDRRMQRAADAYYIDHPVEREAQATQCRQERHPSSDLRCTAAFLAERQEQARERAMEAAGIFGGGTTGPILAPRFN